MARPKATPEQREEIRRGIQIAAAEIYRANGISGISARAVAKEAGVSVGAIYAHFGDLTGLMQSLWTGRVEKQNAVFRETAAAHEAPLDKITALLCEYLRFGVANIQLYRNAFLFVRPESHDAPEKQPVGSMEFAALLLEAIRAAQKTGDVVQSTPETVLQILWSGLHGAMALPLNFDRLDFQPTGEIAASMVDALVKSVSA